MKEIKKGLKFKKSTKIKEVKNIINTSNTLPATKTSANTEKSPEKAKRIIISPKSSTPAKKVQITKIAEKSTKKAVVNVPAAKIVKSTNKAAKSTPPSVTASDSEAISNEKANTQKEIASAPAVSRNDKIKNQRKLATKSAQISEPKAKLLTIQQVADELGLATKTLRRWEAKGIFKAQRTEGNQRRYTQKEVEELKLKIRRPLIEAKNKTVSASANETGAIIPSYTSFEAIAESLSTDPTSFYPAGSFESAVAGPSYKVKSDTASQAQKTEEFETQSKRYSIRLKTATIFMGVIAVVMITAGAAGVGLLPHIIAGLNKTGNESPQASGSLPGVLADTVKLKGLKGEIAFNLPAVFNKNVFIDADATVSGKLTAPNITYRVLAGQNILVKGDPQNPTISTGPIVTSLGGQTGELVLEGGSGITVNDLEISLTNTSLTVAAGNGLGGGGKVELGSSITLTNTGVVSLKGTTNQVIVSNPKGDVTLSLPQDIDTTASVDFANLDLSTSLTVLGTSAISGVATFTHAPTLAHTYAPWPTGTSNGADASLYINPAISVADGNLLVAAVNGVAKFVVDAEGDIYGRNLLLTGAVTQGSTTVAGDLFVTGNTTLGDAATDTITFNGRFTSDILPSVNNTYNLGSSALRWANVYATTFTGTTVNATNINGAITPTGFTQGSVAFAGTGGTLTQDNANFFWDDTNNRLGIGTTAPTNLLHIRTDQNGTSSLAVENRTAGTLSNAVLNITSDTGSGNLAAQSSLYTGAASTGRPNGISLYTSGGSTGGISLAARNAGGIITIHTGGDTERMRIDSAGNVGIGTTTPIVPLQMVGTNGAFIAEDTNVNATNKLGRWGIQAYDTTQLPFYGVMHQTSSTANNLYLGGGTGLGQAATSVIFQVASALNTGIGTTRFSINNNSTSFVDATAGNLTVRPSTDAWVLEHTGNTGNLFLRSFEAGDTSGNLILNDIGGNVGIGTATPLSLFSVGSTSQFQVNSSGQVTYVNGATDTATAVCKNAAGQLAPCNTTGTGAAFVQDGNSFGALAMLGTNDAFGLAFETGGVEKMRILTDGNVGIGTTVPGSYKLNVNGSLNASGSTGMQSFVNFSGTLTDTAAGATVGINNVVVMNPASASLAEFRAYNMSAQPTGAQNFNIVTGTHGETRFNGTGSATTLRGGFFQTVLPAAAVNFGTITNAFGAEVIGLNEFASPALTSGTVTNAIGLKVSQSSKLSAGLTLTNNIGIYGDSQTLGTNNAGIVFGEVSGSGNQSNLVLGQTTIPTGSYSIYNASAKQNYFAGNVGIGVTNPAAALAVGTGSLFKVTSAGLVSYVDGATDTATAVCKNAAGQLAPCNTTGTGAAFVQGGNSFGAAAMLGTNDAFGLAFETSGTEKMRILTDGNVGIGTTAPAYKMQISSSASVVSSAITNTGTGVVYANFRATDGNGIDAFFGAQAGSAAAFGSVSNNNVQLFTNNTVKVTINTAGNVGIGNAASSALFSVGSTSQFQVSSAGLVTYVDGATNTATAVCKNAAGQLAPCNTTGTGAAFVQDGNSFGSLAMLGTNDAFGLAFETSGTEKVRIDTSGNVGIGITNPTKRLEIATTGVNNDFGITLAGTDFITITSVGSAGNMFAGTLAQDSAFRTNNHNMFLGTLGAFAVNISTNNTRRMIIDGAGNVGIGTTSPLSLFSVGSTSQFQVNSSGQVTYVDGTTNTATHVCKNAAGQLAPCNTTGTGAAFVQGGNSFGAAAMLGTNDTFDLAFETDGVEKMRILTGGNVGIGTAAPAALLNVSNTNGTASTIAHFRGSINSPSEILVLSNKNSQNNVNNDFLHLRKELNGGIFSAAGQGVGLQFQMENTSKVLQTSGAIRSILTTAGANNIADLTFSTQNGATFAEAMRITGAGNVGIGNTAPANKLSVNALTTADSLAQVAISPGSTTNKGLVIQGVLGQTGALQHWQTSTGSILATINADGRFLLGPTTSTVGMMRIATDVDARAGLVIIGTAAQSADLFLVQNNSSVTMFNISAAGTVGIGTGATTHAARLHVNTGGTGNIGQVIRGVAGQTANLQEWQNSASTALATITPAGNFTYVDGATDTATHVCKNAAGQLAPCNTTGTGAAFVQGGNTFTALATLGTNDAFGLAFETSGTEKVRLDTAGNVGIGTTAPIAKLDIVGSQNFSAFTAPGALTAGTPTSGGSCTAGTHSYVVTFTSVGAGETTAGTVSNIITCVLTSGQTVPLSGIPTGPAGTTTRKIYRTVAGNTGSHLLLTTIADNTTTTFSDTIADASLGAAAPVSNTTAVANIQTGGTNRLTIDNSGNVGIGTTGPRGKLDVVTGGTTQGMYLVDGGSNFPRIYFGGTNASILGVINRLTTTASLYFGETVDTGGYVFRGSGNSSFDGNVGIGTTAPGTKLDVNGGLRISGGTLTGNSLSLSFDAAGGHIQSYASLPLLLNELGNNVGIGNTAPLAKLNATATTEQLRLSYDASNYSSFTTSSGGDLTIAPSGGDTNLTGTLDVSGHAAFGGTGAINTSRILHISETMTNTSDPIGISNNPNWSLTADNATTAFGISNTLSITGTGSQTGTARSGAAFNNLVWNSSGTATNLIASENIMTLGSSSGAVSIARALYGRVDHSSAATLGTASTIEIGNPLGTGPITNLKGLHVTSMTRGSSNNYGIQIDPPSGATNNYTLYLTGTGGTASTGIQFGADTTLYRSAADTLKTDDSFEATGDLAINGGDFTTTAATFNLLNTNATTLNIGGATGAGGVNIAGGSASTGCTVDGSNGNLACSGSISGTSASFTGNLTPSADNTYDLGTTALRWRKLELGPGSLEITNTTGTSGAGANYTLGKLEFATNNLKLSTSGVGTGNVGTLQLTTGANVGLNIDTTGNVGIGTTAPAAKLHLSGAAITDVQQIFERDIASINTHGLGQLLFKGTQSGAVNKNRLGALIDAIADGAWSTDNATYAPTDLRFFTQDASTTVTTTTPRMIIKSGGNVGIGITAPLQKLAVTGDQTISGYIRVGSNTAPVNTTAGDITATRLALSNTAFSATTGQIAQLSGTLTDTAAGATLGNSLAVSLNPASASSSQFRANNIAATVTAGNAQDFSEINGIWNEVRMLGSGNVTIMRGAYATGLRSQAAAANFGTVTNLRGIEITAVDNNGGTSTGTIANAHGVLINNSVYGSMTGTSQSGLSIAAISGATNNTGLLMGTTSIPTGNFGIYNASTNNNYFAGNVGIGTVPSSAKLDIFKNTTTLNLETDYAIRITDGSALAGLILGTSSGTPAGLIQAFDPATNWTGVPLVLQPNGGNVGIGTTAPSVKLHIATGLGTIPTLNSGTGLIVQNNASTSDRSRISIIAGNAAFSTVEFSDAEAAGIGVLQYDHTLNSFATVVNGGTRTYIDSAGNVGIGTTAPGGRLDVASTQTSGTISLIGAPSAVTLAGALTGQNINLSTNYTATGQSVTGQAITLPAVTNTGAASYAYRGLQITGGALVQNTGAGTNNWYGIDITTPDQTQNTGSVTSTGIRVVGGAITSGTQNLIELRDSANQRFLVSSAGQIIQTNANQAGNAYTLTADGLTTAHAMAISSTSNAFTGSLLNLSKTAATGSTAYTGDIINTTYSQTFNGGVGLDSTGNVLDISRAITLNNAGNTHTISGALATFSDSGTQTAGTLTSTADVMRIAQNYTANTGSALNVTSAGANAAFALRINDDGTFTDSSPFVIDNTGNVGIGTTAPGSLLHAYGGSVGGAVDLKVEHNSGTAGQASLTLQSTGSGGRTWSLVSADTAYTSGSGLHFLSNGSNFMTLNASGNLGVGTTTPTLARLQVAAPSGSFSFVGADATADAAVKLNRIGVAHYTNSEEPITMLMGYASGANSGELFVGGGSSVGNAFQTLSFYTATNTTTLSGSERMRIASNGSVGIGTTAPGTRQLLVNTASGSTNDVAFEAFNSDITGADFAVRAIANGVGGTTHYGLYATATGATNNYAAIFDQGNVGIGTLAPTRKLHISGDGSATYASIDADAAQQAGLEFTKDFSQKWVIYVPGGSNDLRFFDSSTSLNPVTFKAGGNVGIGTTSPASLFSVGTTTASNFKVNADGDITSSFVTLNGTTTANGAGTNSTTLILAAGGGANFDVGNYVQVDPTGVNTCSGTETVCYAKITAKATDTLTISPALTWDTGAAVVEVHVPEVGGINLSQAITNRYGRGYFIDGIVTGNGSTSYTDSAIQQSLASSTFNFLDNGSTGTINIGTSATTTNIPGTLNVTGTAASTFNGNITINKADPTLIYNVATAGDTDFWAGVTDDADGLDDDLYQIGLGTTPGTTPYLTINQAGNVGIGTTTPIQLHHVNAAAAAASGTAWTSGTTGATTNDGMFAGIDGSGNAYLYQREALSLFLGTNNTTKMTLNSAGNVGIGITAPTSLLHVAGSQPASVGTTPATAAISALNIAGGIGGDTTIATTGVGGIGGALSLTGGTGGVASAAVTASTGGAGGALSFISGAGGAASVTGGIKTGGNGGAFTLLGGDGGATSGTGTSNTGGTGGNIFLVGGAGGAASGATANTAGAAGNVLLAVTSGGVARGNVGIGTTSPQGKLEVIKNTTTMNLETDYALRIADGSSLAGMVLGVMSGTPVGIIQTLDPSNNWTGVPLSFQPNGGNVGIGTTAPSAGLDVQTNGSIQLHLGKTSNAGKIGFRRGTDGAETATIGWAGASEGANFNFSNTSGGSAFSFTTNYNSLGSERMRLTSGGDLGIGTTTPAGLLDVTQSTGGPGVVTTNGTTTLTGTNTEFLNTFKVGDTITVSGETVRTITAIANNGNLTVSVAFTTTASNLNYTLTGGSRLAVLGNGNVGIGTTAPLTPLEVVTTPSANVETDLLTLRSNVVGNNTTTLKFVNSTTPGTDLGGGEIAVARNATVANGGDMIFRTANSGSTMTERMRLDGNGNVGIGTTAPTAKLQITGSSDINQILIVPNATQTSNTIAVQMAGTANLGFAVNGGGQASFNAPVGTSTLLTIGSTGYGGFSSASQTYGTFTTAVNTGLGNITGVYGQPVSTAVGTVTSLAGVQGSIRTANAGLTLTAGKMFEALTPTISSGTITTQYGLYINQQDSGASVGAGYGVYQASSADLNYFAGSVGIGETTPAAKLTVSGNAVSPSLSSDTGIFKITSSTTQELAIGADPSSPFGMWLQTKRVGNDNTSYALALNPLGGNVGIGTTAPVAPLTAATAVSAGAITTSAAFGQNSQSDPSTGQGSRIYLGANLNTARMAAIEAVVSNGLNGHHLAFLTQTAGTAATEKVRIDASGNVGIGTTAPAAQLDIRGATGTGVTALRVVSDVNANDFVFKFEGAIDSATNVMAMTQPGNVGIGTTAPGALLDVKGASTGRTLVGVLSDVTSYGAIGFQSVLNSTNYAIAGTSTETLINAQSGSTLKFSIANVEKMRIDTTGNVGIGTTSPLGKLEIKGGDLINSLTDNRITSTYGGFGGTFTNLILNPSFEGNSTSSWSTFGTNTIAADTAQSLHGSYSIKATYNNDLRLAGQGTTLSTSTTYTVSAYVYVPSDWDGGAITFNDDSTFAGRTLTNYNADMTLTNQWQRVSATLVTAADGVGTILVRAVSAPTAGKFIYVDNVQVTTGSSPLAFSSLSSAVPKGLSTIGDLTVQGLGNSYFAGNVGIGTTAPLAKLNSLNTTDQLRLSYDLTNYTTLSTGSTGTLVITPTNSIVSTVGSGTWSGAGTFNFGVNVNNLNNNSNTIIKGQTDSNLFVAIASTNQIGIGTAGPTSKLDVLPTGTFAAAGVSGITQRAHTVTLSGANPTTYATFNASQIGQMTLVGTNAGQTVTDAASLNITGAPIKSTNVALTNTHGLLIGAGAVSTATNSYGLTVNTQTGATNNYAAAFLGGNVGIGTTAPVAPLHVVSSTATQYAKVAILGTHIGDGNFNLATKRGETTNVSGDIAAKLSLDYNSIENATINFHRGASTTGGFLSFATNTGAERMRIDTAGNVGIGTTGPAGKLHVTSSTSGSGPVILAPNTGTTSLANNQGLQIYWNRSNGTQETELVYGAASNSYLSFTHNNAGTFSERMRIDSGGNVGIGTTAPTSLLHVAGSQPASVGTTPATAASSALNIAGGIGGNTTIATTGVGGIGGTLSLTGGTGGVASAAVTASTGGAGGALTFTTGTGGAAAVTGGVKLGGAGGAFSLVGGDGGATSGTGTSNTGGSGGDIFLVGGAGGAASGATANTAGAAGNVLLAVTSGGTARGNVGIGTTAPTEGTLHIIGNTSVSAGSAASPGYKFNAANTGMFAISGGLLGFSVNASERMRIDNSGNVGIGTTAPLSLLEVAGKGQFGTAAATTSQLSVLGGSGGNPMITLTRTSGASIQYSWALAGGGLSFQDDTNGVLTTNIFGDSSTAQLFLGNRGKNTSDAFSGLLSGQTFSAAAGTDVNAHNLTIRAGAGTGAGANGHLIFSTKNTLASGTTVQTYTERMRIEGNTGNVGIGTTSPTSLLHIVNAQPGATLDWSNTANYGALSFLEAGSYRGAIQYIGSTFATTTRRNNLEIVNAIGGGAVSIFTNATEKVRVDSAGNVGIGTTAPAALLDVDRADIASNSELIDIRSQGFTQTIAAGLTNARFNQFNQSTLTSVAAQTVTNAATVYIAGAPIAAGSTTITNNYGLWVDSGNARFDGNVGIGTTAPTRTLDVTGDQGGNVVTDSRATETVAATYTVATKALAYYLSSNSTTTNSTFATTFNITGLSNTEGSYAFIYTKAEKGITVDPHTHSTTIQINGAQVSTIATTTGTAADTGKLENYIIMYVNGAWRISGYGPTAASNTTVDTADLAEWIPYTGDRPVEGEVLTTGDAAVSVKKSTTAYDKKLIGIVTTNPYTVMSAETPNSVKLALSGRVPVKVSAEGGSIKAGDYITSSSIAGVGMKAARSGFVVGKALEDWTPESGKTTVMVLVNVAQVDPLNVLASLSFDQNGNLIIPTNPDEEVTQLGGTPTTDSPAVKKDLSWNLADIVRRLQKLEESTTGTTSTTDTTSTDSAKLEVLTGKVDSNTTDIGNLKSDLSSLKSKVASIEAELITYNLALITNNASSSAELGLENIDVKTATISGSLSVGGRTTLSDVGITGKMNIGLLAIEGLNENGFATLNTSSGALKIQSDGINGVDILNGKVVIEPTGAMKVDGAITVKKVNVDTSEVAGASLGEGILESGTTSVVIKTSSVTAKSKIFTTPKSKTSLPLSVTTQTAGDSFKVEINAPTASDIKFSWFIVN